MLACDVLYVLSLFISPFITLPLCPFPRILSPLSYALSYPSPFYYLTHNNLQITTTNNYSTEIISNSSAYSVYCMPILSDLQILTLLILTITHWPTLSFSALMNERPEDQ